MSAVKVKRTTGSEGATSNLAHVESDLGGEARIILVADDDEDDQILVADAFREAGILNPLRFVRNGEELMSYLQRRENPDSLPPGTRPGLLILDLNMPRKDGREALREIKDDPHLRSIPVIVLTTSDTQEDVDLIYALGANSFITKPVTFDGLVNSLRILGHYWFRVAKLPGASC
jgi:CheY-like chemotaxis protein